MYSQIKLQASQLSTKYNFFFFFITSRLIYIRLTQHDIALHTESTESKNVIVDDQRSSSLRNDSSNVVDNSTQWRRNAENL
jgi:hypothetical protein